MSSCSVPGPDTLAEIATALVHAISHLCRKLTEHVMYVDLDAKFDSLRLIQVGWTALHAAQ